MTLDRRAFLRRSTIALAGGLLVGDAALEAFERLTHSKVFALGAVPDAPWKVVRWAELRAEIDFVYARVVTQRAGLALPGSLYSFKTVGASL